MAFNGSMLALARQIEKLSQEQLVDLMRGDLSQGILSKIERGRVQPDEDVVERLAEALDVRPSFFYNDAYIRQPPISYHRKRKKLRARDLQAIHAIAEVIRLSLEKCLDSVEFDHDGPELPSFDLDQFSGDARQAALAVRAKLRLPRGPVKNLSRVIESSGVIVIPLNFGTPLVDGFCQHPHNGLPSVIFINASLPVDRWRFSLAHEMGHLVCHDTPNPEQEIQANQFASEFLMPSSDISNDLKEFSLAKAMELKLYWGTSMQSLIEKAWSLGRIGDARRRNLYIEMSRRGWRQSEPVEARGFIEKASTFEGILKAIMDGLGYGVEEMADMFGITSERFRSYFPVVDKKPHLRVVASN